MMEDVGLDDIELVQISTKDLNRHLKKRGIDKLRQSLSGTIIEGNPSQ